MFDIKIPEIQNYDIEMRKSMRDKMFFLDYIDADVYVDYGCADGTLFEFMANIDRTKRYIGFDLSEEQLTLARNKNIVNASFYSDFQEVERLVQEYKASGKTVAVIANSIIHEIYSYLDQDGIDKFWGQIYDTGFDYICIRDMGVSSMLERQNGDVLTLYQNVKTINNTYNQDRLLQFEKIWGSISEIKNYVHFLLKYRYEKNWKREVNENYLGIDVDKLAYSSPKNMRVLWFETFSLPFIRNQVQRDFGFDFPLHTHFKLILSQK